MQTMKFSNSAVCPKCGGMLSYEAAITDKLPLGLGFAPDSSRFQIDILVRKGWRGQCMDCHAVVFAVKSSRHVTKYPQRINRKIRAAQAA